MTATIEMLGPKVESFSGWSRRCRVAGVEYHVSVRRGKAVRIPYKPRGKNRGFQWYGTVICNNPREQWCDRVNGSIGVRGLLLAAGVDVSPEQPKEGEP